MHSPPSPAHVRSTHTHTRMVEPATRARIGELFVLCVSGEGAASLVKHVQLPLHKLGHLQNPRVALVRDVRRRTAAQPLPATSRIGHSAFTATLQGHEPVGPAATRVAGMPVKPLLLTPAVRETHRVRERVASRPAGVVLGQISAPFPPAAAHRLLLSDLTAAIACDPGLSCGVKSARCKERDADFAAGRAQATISSRRALRAQARCGHQACDMRHGRHAAMQRCLRRLVRAGLASIWRGPRASGEGRGGLLAKVFGFAVARAHEPNRPWPVKGQGISARC